MQLGINPNNYGLLNKPTITSLLRHLAQLKRY